MPRIALDMTGNTAHASTMADINTMMSEQYAGAAANPNWTGTSVAATGGVSGATLTATGLSTTGTARLDTGTKTATATGGAATLAKSAGVITTEALTTAAAATYTLTLTNSTIAAVDQVFASLALGTSTGGTPVILRVTPGAGSVAIVVQNIHASVALNGTLVISFMSLKN